MEISGGSLLVAGRHASKSVWGHFRLNEIASFTLKRRVRTPVLVGAAVLALAAALLGFGDVGSELFSPPLVILAVVVLLFSRRPSLLEIVSPQQRVAVEVDRAQHDFVRGFMESSQTPQAQTPGPDVRPSFEAPRPKKRGRL